MSTSSNLSITFVAASANQKEVVMNEAITILDGAYAGQASVNLDGLSGNQTPDSDTMIRCLVVAITGALTGAVNLIVPDNNKPYWVVHGGTAENVTIKTAAGSGITITPGNAQMTYCNGTNVIAISSAGAGGAAEATAKNRVWLSGAGSTTDIAIGANVNATSVEVYKERLKMKPTHDYTVTESVPASGDYDQITPAYSDAFPNGDQIELLYYAP